MKKFIIIAVLVISWLFSLNKANNVFADWWQRPSVFPTQPSFTRPLESNPTTAPTSAPSQPTVAPTSSPSGGTPSTGGGSSGSGGNACDPGKPFVGPYCGWSPNVNNSGGGGGGGSSEQPRVGGPRVLGLSNTSSGNLSVSDIMILAGILCLAVYARSKIAVNNKLH